MIKTLRIIIALALLTTISYFGLITYEHSKIYEATTTQIASACDANSLASERIDELTSIISLGLVKNKSKEVLQKLKKSQTDSKEMAEKHLYYFMGTLVLTLLFTFTCTLRAGAMILSFATFISLIYGLINPILMVTIHKQVDYLGDVILSFESKGIIGSISKLFESGEFAVAFTILLFSILLPAVKSLTLTFMLIFYEHPWNQKMVTFFKQIG
ncbi:MAG: paraquat-inducible protein A, partial [Sulfurovaceae bacterium]|nr:paraquat-inducible protein A [Sulfurovaceae bacterium]